MSAANLPDRLNISYLLIGQTLTPAEAAKLEQEQEAKLNYTMDQILAEGDLDEIAKWEALTGRDNL